MQGNEVDYTQRQPNCPFCNAEGRTINRNDLAFVIKDKHPVTDGHSLIIPCRHVSDYFSLYPPERNAIDRLLIWRRYSLIAEDSSIKGFNVGINVGTTAGQSVLHVHIHLIPRRAGDVADPQGGVRGVIPGKQKYKKEK